MYFLRQVAENIINSNASQLDDLTIVFPSKRAGLFFQEELKIIVREKGINATWLPKIKAIDEFLLDFSDKLIPEQLDLIFILYKCYLKVYYDQQLNQIEEEEEIVSFDKFYPFGEMLLKDFQEVDSYLANPDQVFFDLSSLEEIREKDLETFLQYEAVKRFVENFSKLSDSDPKERFSFFWNRLNPFYKEFHHQLDQKNWSYNGKEYRAVWDVVKEETFDITNPVCFAGFNALTIAEEKIIGALLKTGKCKVFWKYDDVFLGKKHNEGSRFLKEYIKKWDKYDNSIVVKSTNATKEKQLNIVNTSSQVAQVKFVADKLTQLPANEIHQTLIVLSDESLLNPFLDSVPPNIDKLNVTMGFPLRNSNFWSFIISLFKIISTLKDEKIYHKWGQMFMESSIIAHRYPEDYRKIIDEVNRQGEIYIEKEFLQQFDAELSNVLLDVIKYKFTNAVEFVLFLNTLLATIVSKDLGEEDLIAYFHFKKQLNRLEAILVENDELSSHLSLDFTIKTITQLIQSTKIPYEGQPLEGLQIMGPLEIRVLDFKNIYFLSMNEGVYPHGSQRTSLLPYSLRKAFDLPTFETQESIYAHHFHALLQNSENITGVYVTKEGGVGASEKSRFLTQILYEKEEYPNLKISEKVVSYSLGDGTTDEISIHNTEAIVAGLIEKYNLEDRYLSPSAIISFLECELKYYYRYVAGVKESNVLSEDLEHVDIGKIIHKALELMFEEHKLIDEKVLKLLLTKVDTYVNRALEDPEVNIKNQKGYNHFIIKGARQYVIKYLENSRKELPIENTSVEELLTINYPINDTTIKLGGNIDLITFSNNSISLIDYKTGKMPYKTTFPKDFEVFKKDIKGHKNQFQVMFYAYLFNKNKNIKDFKVQLRYLMNNKSLGRNSMSDEELDLFEIFLNDVVSVIMNKENSFSQTEDVEKCLYCPFKLICDK